MSENILRLGNYIHLKCCCGQLIMGQVTSLEPDYIGMSDAKVLNYCENCGEGLGKGIASFKQGIPITQELLSNVGAKRSLGGHFYSFTLFQNEEVESLDLVSDNRGLFVLEFTSYLDGKQVAHSVPVKIKYLHQLQNMLHSFGYDELILKNK